MAVLDLKSIARAAFNDLDRRARNGDQEARDWLREIWDGADPVACFLCDVHIDGEHAVNGKPWPMILPETTNDELIIAPLCRACGALPKMIRMSRCLRLLRAMHRARTGKAIGFCFAPRRGH